MPFFVTLFKTGSPMFDTVPQEGDDCTSVAVVVDAKAEATLKSLVALGSFEVAQAIAAVYAAGVNAGERAARSRGSPAAVPPRGAPPPS